MINERYIIKKALGKGRSRVFLCEDNEFPGKELAIKILPANADTHEVEVFQEEFFTLKKLNHPHIINANEFGVIVKNEPNDKDIELSSKFFTLEYFDGIELLKVNGLKDEYYLREIITQISSILYYLHQSNYIYYDLKPENILVKEINGEPFIKMVDFGFAAYITGKEKYSLRGTAEYIAPELLRKEAHDHRVDLYSLGILLYRIIYNHFPFDTKDELEIYKAHVEKEFEFSVRHLTDNFSKEIINALKKLLKKDPSERYNTTLQLLYDLQIPVDDNITKDWFPAKVFADRRDTLNVIKSFISDDSSSEVFVIKGFEGSGKTSVADEIFSRNKEVIRIYDSKSKSGYDFLRWLLKKIVYTEFVYSRLSLQLKNKIEEFIQNPPVDITEELKAIFTKLTTECNFVLILDDFNRYDNFTLEIFRELIPILQVNKIKTILTEESDYPYVSNFIYNLRELNLTPFTDQQVKDFLEKSYFSLFPREELKKVILLFADLLPGSIESFINDLILLKIISFLPDGPVIRTDENSINLLRSSHDEIYNLRLNTLNDKELELSKIISSFDITLDKNIIGLLIEKFEAEVERILAGLQQKNIIRPLHLSPGVVFVSEGLKKYIYSNIYNKKEFHDKIASKLFDKVRDFNKNELSRHFELAERHKESYKILKEEIKQAEKFSAYSYQKKIYKHLLSLPLNVDDKNLLKYDLSFILFKLGENKEALETIEEIEKTKLSKEKIRELLVLKGNSLIEYGEPLKGEEVLNNVLPQIKDEKKKQSILSSIATAEFELNKYSEVKDRCSKIIQSNNTPFEERGKCYNLLALTEIFQNNNLDMALLSFEKAEKSYLKADSKLKVSTMEMNLGNIYNIKGDYEKAEFCWNKSLETNQLIGNLEQEALLLLNYGAYHYTKLNLEKAVENYQRAFSIFVSLGNKKGEGLIQSNLGEIYLLTCEYQKALDVLRIARNIFKKLQKPDEELESLFLQGKLYYTLGDVKQLESILEDFRIIIEGDNHGEKNKNNFNYLTQLYYLSKDRDSGFENNIKELRNIRKNFLVQGDKFNYFNSTTLIINLLLELKLFDEALDELTAKEFVEISSKKYLFDAEKEYLMGKLASLDPAHQKPPIEFYNSTYELIKKEEVTELTWKVLYAIGFVYFERGNFEKAKDYIIYSRSILEFIASNIKDQQLRNSYLQIPERKVSLEQLDKWLTLI